MNLKIFFKKTLKIIKLLLIAFLANSNIFLVSIRVNIEMRGLFYAFTINLVSI